MLRQVLKSGLVAAGAIVLPTLSAEAALIGVQLPHGQNVESTHALLATQTAGVIPQASFNAITALTASNVALVDSLATSTAVTFSISATDAWHTGVWVDNYSPANFTLVSGKVGAAWYANDSTYTFGNVAAGTYDLIVYTVNKGGPTSGDYTVGTKTFYITQQQGDVGIAGAFGNVWLQASNTTNLDTSRDLGNYVRFNGITPDVNGNITLTGSKNAAINALQLSAVPEPASIGLLMISGAILARRRQR